MGTKLDLTGQKFGRLTAVKEVGLNSAGVYKWLCVCDCGREHIVRASNLRNGNTSSCGCLNKDAVKKAVTKHGHTVIFKTTEYCSWESMIGRCYNINLAEYKDYGGRGIFVCGRWRESFSYFLNDMGAKPSMLHSIERINNNEGYFKENCKWATRTEQSRNRRNNVWLEYRGEKMVMQDWAKRFNTFGSSIRGHLKTKSFEQVVEFFKNKNEKISRDNICI